jgi:hypothetical protein
VEEVLSTHEDSQSSQDENIPQSPQRSITPALERVDPLLTSTREQTPHKKLGLAWSYAPKIALERAPNTLDADYTRRVAQVHQLQSESMNTPLAMHTSPSQYAHRRSQLRVHTSARQAPDAVARAPLVHRSISLAAQYMPIAPAPITVGYAHIDHEANMIDNLIHHVRDSLAGTAPDLPEIKGLRMKLPEAYTGKDDFDKMDNWL